MELRQLRYFLALCRTMNFTRAAEEVNIAQPPFSRQISNLEDELGARLIDRDSRPMRLTSSGRFVQERALEIVARIERLKQEAVQLGRGGRQVLRIGFEVSVLYGHLPPVIKHLRDLNPHLDIDLRTVSGEEQFQAIRNGEIDIGVGRDIAHDDEIDQIPIRQEPFLVALSPRHPLAQTNRPGLTFADLAGETVICHYNKTGGHHTDAVAQMMERAGYVPLRKTPVGDLLAALGLVAAESGITIVPATVRRMRNFDVTYKLLEEEGAVSTIYLATARGLNAAIVKQTRDEIDRLINAQAA